MSESDSDDSSAQGYFFGAAHPGPEPHPLFDAIWSGDLDAVKRLIAGVPVDCTDLLADCGSYGWTPLERAVYHGRVDIVKFLIGEGADVQRYGQYSTTPLHSTLFNSRTNDHIACVKLLIAAGADVNAADGVQEPLMVAMRYTSAADNHGPICRRIVRVLLQAGAIISDVQLGWLQRGTSQYDLMHPYLKKIVNAGGIKAYAKAHRARLVAVFVPKLRLPADVVPLVVDYGFHVGFY